MKKFLFLILLAALPVTAAASVSVGDYSVGLAGYWPLEEGSGSSVRDIGGGGKTALLTGSPTWTTGRFGKALQFTGSPQVASTSLSWPSNGGSMSVWVYPTSYSDWISPAGWKLLGTNNGFILLDEGGSGSPGKWRAVFNPNNTSGPGEVDAIALQNITQNTWQHLVMTWSLSGSTYTVKLYLNGVLQSSVTWTGTPGANGVGHFHFGNSGDFADNYFLGKVDDVRVYNYALSYSQVKALYTVGTPATNVAHSNTTTLSSGLVGFWPLDGGTLNWSTGKATDASGNANTGQLVALSTSTSVVSGKIGQALQFKSASSQYITVPSASSLNPSSKNFTISTWVKRATAGSTGPIVDKSGVYAFDIGVSPCTGSQVKLTKYNVVDVCIGTFPSDTNYHHLVAVWSTTGITLYVDGAINGTSADTSSFSSGTGALTIGYDSGDNVYFSGSIDDVRVYGRALSATEVQQLYVNGGGVIGHSNTVSLSSGLVGYWPFDGNKINWATGVVNDASGQGNTGTMVSMSTTSSPIAGKVGQAINLKASGQYITGSVSTPATTYSVSAWVRYQGTTPISAIKVAVSYGSGSVPTIWMGYALDGSLAVSNSSTDIKSSTVSNSKTWHHLVASVQGSTMTAYADGVSIGTASMTSRSANTLVVGDYVGSIGSFPFTGMVDDVRVYNRALSAQEVSQLYASTK